MRKTHAHAEPDSNSEQTVRLNKLIADCGIASRRAADKIIEEGRITINGKKVYELGIKVDPKRDNVLFDGKPIRAEALKVYLIFNKPRGVLTTMDDPHDRPTIAQYLDKVPVRVFPVGRLDWDSEGMLLLTNDGDLANKIMHPKTEVTKTYLVKLDGTPAPDKIQKLLKGVSIVGGKVAAKLVEKVKKGDSEKYEWYKIVITEGKNRQIRQMFEKIGFDVLKLQRIAIGKLNIGNIKRGEVVYLNEDHLGELFESDLPKTPEQIKVKKASKRMVSSKRAPAKKSLKSSKKLFRASAKKQD